MVQIFVRQLLLALKHMHDMRIAHLDLRPETILLQDNKLKLADFGQSSERMTVDEALEHPWLSDPNLKTVPLSADSLREFKYQHKWLTYQLETK
ncbi:hypothetical protein ANCDUO_19592 [Ancylostoma duodenale]|uniref:Protein kinase domain-containing protein n=1 Tax=Ancylostoma duodenale TaxID=51022 RepID=A0A0C2FP21_9BILA|nr:hypothetical protein ANCDUO_19592 [Ancylostoma duodenale]